MHFIKCFTCGLLASTYNAYSVDENFPIQIFDHANNQNIVTRAAFDIGSGETKITVGDIDLRTNRMNKIWHKEVLHVKLRNDLANSPDGLLSHHIQSELIDAIKDLKDKVSAYNPIQWAAIGTSVFRTAKNGSELLKKIEEDTSTLSRLN